MIDWLTVSNLDNYVGRYLTVSVDDSEIVSLRWSANIAVYHACNIFSGPYAMKTLIFNAGTDRAQLDKSTCCRDSTVYILSITLNDGTAPASVLSTRNNGRFTDNEAALKCNANCKIVFEN